MPENGKEESKKQIRWVRSPNGMVDVHTNSWHTQWSLDDVRVRFAQLVKSPDHATPGPDFKQRTYGPFSQPTWCVGHRSVTVFGAPQFAQRVSTEG